MTFLTLTIIGIAVSSTPGDQVSPFGNVIGLSLGYVIVLLMAIPMGYFNLDDNIWIQNGNIFRINMNDII
jgi:hypothetical protein